MTDEQHKRKIECDRENRRWKKERHLCIRCGKQDAYTLNGYSRCFECLQAHREYEKERWKDSNVREMKKERTKKLYDERIKNRQCVRCGRGLSPYETTKHCARCRAKFRIQNDKKRIKKRILPRFLFDGVDRCKKCGKEEIVPGYKVCNKCLEDNRRAIQKALNTPREPNHFEKSIRSGFYFK